MKNTMTKAGIATIVAATAAISAAQTNGPTGYSVRLGAYFPNTGSSNVNVGLDYKINSARVPAQGNGTQPAYLGVSLDYYGDGDNFSIPLALTYNVRASQNFIVFAGVGPQYNGGNDDDRIDFGAQIGANYEFATEGEGSNPIFVSAKYFFGGRSDSSGFAVGVGYRF
ncbi:hypothetical protein EON81_24265 [bacterium]|nr:MAG: hypothetical protein EON81_24265 [bacterium]